MEPFLFDKIIEIFFYLDTRNNGIVNTISYHSILKQKKKDLNDSNESGNKNAHKIEQFFFLLPK